MDNHVDVVVVGGGPAGLATAEVTARSGLKTIIFEKNESIGIPTRTSGGSWINDLIKLRIPETFYHPVHRLRIQSVKNQAYYEYQKALACIIDVRRLYQYLAEKAINAGAAIQLKTTIERPILQDGRVSGVVIRTPKSGSEEQVSANIVVDASGYSGLVSKKAGINPGYRSFGFGAEYDLYAPNFDEDEALLLLGAATAPNGYGWAFPYGNHRVRLGVGVIRPKTNEDPREYLDGMVDRNPYLADKLARSSPIEFHTGLFPIYPPAGCRFVMDGLITVGDAAGQGSSLLGEGIRFAVASGRLAGDAICTAFTQSNFSSSMLRKYEKQWLSRYLWNMRVAYWIHRQIVQFTDEDWEGLMPVLNQLSPAQIAQGLYGDFSLTWGFGILSSHPDIILKTMRKLTR